MVVDVLEKAEAIRIAEIHQGFLDGQSKSLLEVAKMMLKNGESLEKIMMYTNLSAEHIESLQENNGDCSLG